MSIEDQKAQPKKVSVDGQTVENRSIDELTQTETDDDVASAKASNKMPFKLITYRNPGAVR